MTDEINRKILDKLFAMSNKKIEHICIKDLLINNHPWAEDSVKRGGRVMISKHPNGLSSLIDDIFYVWVDDDEVFKVNVEKYKEHFMTIAEWRKQKLENIE
jgi:hypothetical protein